MAANTTHARKIECLARHLLSNMTLVQRRAFLARYKGDVSELKAELSRQHASRLEAFELQVQAESRPSPSDHEQRVAALKANRESYARLAAEPGSRETTA